MATNIQSCAAGNPFMKLGEGNNAPILNYNLPQTTCYHGNGYFPIHIPQGYFDSKYTTGPVGNPWDVAAALSLEQITAQLRTDAMAAENSVLLQNATLLRRRKDLVKFLSDNGTSYLVRETKTETVVVDDSTLRTASPETATSETTQESTPIGRIDIGRVNHLTAIPSLPAEKIQICGFTLDYLAAQVASGLIPEMFTEFGGKVSIRFLPKPVSHPRITLIEHYKTCAYLGDYGAGKTLKTFTLLPGERTSITVKSYKDRTSSYVKSSATNSNEYTSSHYSDDETSTSTRSENILDSFSQYSADQLQSHIESQVGSMTGSQNSNSFATQAGSGGGTQGGFNLLGVYNFQTGSSNQVTTGNAATSNAIREDHMSVLNSALEASVNESGQYRDVEVNTTTGNMANTSSSGNNGTSASISVSQQESMMIKSGEASLTVRHLHNINHSRVLNFVFRQLLQEYIVLTHLHDVSIVFSTGYAAQGITVRLSQLNSLIETVIPDPNHQAEVRKAILLHLCNVTNYQGTNMAFSEKVAETWNDCVDGSPQPTVAYWRKRAGLADSYTAGGLEISVKGIITSASSHILRTDSVIADAILGQGEALDCYNARLQEAAAASAELRNVRYAQETAHENGKVSAALAAIAAIADPEARATAYKKVFGDCCTEDLLTQLNLNAGTPA